MIRKEKFLAFMLGHFLIGEDKMKIEGIGNLIPNLSELQKPKVQENENFGATFSDFIKSVNDDQNSSAMAVEKFVSGDGVELHDVMVAGEKAKTSLQLLMEIRNKTIDMFKQLTNMPV
jgi:flagellar hook-basal body complex protein FliE